jgi:hypothetical protein
MGPEYNLTQPKNRDQPACPSTVWTDYATNATPLRCTGVEEVGFNQS